MTSTSYQTIRLGRGKHASPAEGACVMELASMLAREPFSDHPVSVCPVIGAFLRTYNDSVEDGRRQDLYAYASKVVGSRATEAVERARQAHLERWARRSAASGTSRLRLPRWLGLLCAGAATDIQAAVAVYEVTRRGPRGHAQALALIDELLAIGRAEPAGGASGPPARECRRHEVGTGGADHGAGDDVAGVVNTGVHAGVGDQRGQGMQREAGRGSSRLTPEANATALAV